MFALEHQAVKHVCAPPLARSIHGYRPLSSAVAYTRHALKGPLQLPGSQWGRISFRGPARHVPSSKSFRPAAFWGGQSPNDRQLAPSDANRRGDMMTSLEMGHDPPPPRGELNYNGTFLLLIISLVVFAADHILHLPSVRFLYLYHASPRWYQFLTATFCHANWAHLSGNLFFLYIFGKLVEEEEGSFGVCASYIVTGVGANLLSWLLLPSDCVSIGASGAVFGLFVVAALVKLSWKWRKMVEFGIVGQFVVEKVVSEAQASTRMGGQLTGVGGINHVAHLGGALIGVLLIYLVTRIPFAGDGNKKIGKGREEL